MTTQSDKAARQAKAAQLRERIARVTGASAGKADAGTAAGQREPTPPPAAPANPPANPRDFIAQRMRELAAKKKK